MCDEARCEREMIPRQEYNITKASRCDIKCCSEDKCNDGKLTVLNLAELSGDKAEVPFISKAEVPFISSLCVITLALASFVLANNWLHNKHTAIDFAYNQVERERMAV